MDDIGFEHALDRVRAGDLAGGTEELRAFIASNPGRVDAMGHLAWLLLSAGRHEEADALYAEMQTLTPGNKEVDFRRAQIAAQRNGASASQLALLRGLARQCPGNSGVWESLAAIAARDGGETFREDVLTEASRLFPDHIPIRNLLDQTRSRRRRGWRHTLFASLGGPAMARLFLKSTAVRSAIMQYDTTSDHAVRLALRSYYDEGSVNASFPQSPAYQRPDRFRQYFNNDPEVWWRWFRDATPEKSPSGKRLLDIGAGPGFIGHHFLEFGYAVTALSGSRAELAECAMRGMATLEAEMHSIPVPAASFDAALASHVLEHSIVPFVLLREIWRVLKPGGLLYVNLPVPIEGDPARDFPECYDAKTDTYDFDVDPMTGRGKNPALSYYSYGFPHHIFVLTYWQWRWLFRHAGFEHLASILDICDTRELLAWEQVERRPDLARVPKNQLFILRKRQDAG